MRWIGMLVLMLAMTGAAATEMWRWVDEQGVTHYSDRPQPGAERVELQSVQSYEAPALPAPAQRTQDVDEQERASPYTRFSITSPGSGETVWNIGGELTVSIAVEPSLRGAHALRLYLDGQQVSGVPSGPTQFTINNVFRGERSLRATIVDEQGRELAESATVVFYVQQTSIATPPGAPPRTQRPAPSPRG